ncbi:cytochrome P450 [Microbacterium enclense]|uniref:cytochrome P450 n=1 Tax=Microbacterium enclense TaxID=993073 RepID=UPI003F7EF22D
MPDGLDFADPDVHQRDDIRAIWREMREHGEIAWQEPCGERSGFWVIARYAQAIEVLRDSEGFASSGGNVLDTAARQGDSAAGYMAPVTDGTGHRALRRVLARLLSPSMLGHARLSVESTARDLIDDGVDTAVVDLGATAAVLPVAAICGLLGVPVSDRARVLGLARSVLAVPQEQTFPADPRIARAELIQYLAALVSRRKHDRGDDGISILLDSSIQGRPMTDHQIVMNCYSLIFGGIETTRLTITTGLHAMIERPDVWQRVMSGDADLDLAVEEMLRWGSAAMHLARTATAERQIGGQTIFPGEIVSVWNVSANFDEREIAHPERFDIDRTPNRHIAFGNGAHFCPGAAFARMEIATFLRQVRHSIAGIELAGAPRVIRSTFLGGVDALPVRFTRKGAHE